MLLSLLTARHVALVETFSAFARTRGPTFREEQLMSLGTIVLIVVILMLVGALPAWPHARSWGYGPSGLLGVILVIEVELFLMGRL